jgi:hypothetical protein
MSQSLEMAAAERLQDIYNLALAKVTTSTRWSR